jgi:hypothetical protein
MHGESNKEALSTHKISMALQTEEDLKLILSEIPLDLIRDRSTGLTYTQWSSLRIIGSRITATPFVMYFNLIGTRNK